MFYPPATVIAVAFFPDSVPPATSAAPSPQVNAAGWHNTDVTVTLSAGDGGGLGVSGITYGAGGAQTVPQTTASGASASLTITAEGETTVTYSATDHAGNAEEPHTLTVRIDKTPPEITITRPADGASYTLGQQVEALYACADAGSGVAACEGPVASGDDVNTAAVGAKSFTVTARDAAGNESAPRTAAYAVGYGAAALYDQTKAHKSGSAIPIKLRLIDAGGGNRSAPALVVQAMSVYLLTTGASGTLADAGDANTDFNFRYDASLGGYIFNLKTTGYATGTYALSFTVSSDPTVHTVQFQVKG